MLAEPDYYRILDVPPNSDAQTIKSAYRLKARQLHPDRHPNDPNLTEAFKALTEAYGVLADPAKRSLYDRQRQRLESKPPVSTPASTLGSFFKKLFSAKRPAENGKDLHTKLSVDLTDLVAPSKVRLELPSTRACPACSGQGLSPAPNQNDEPENCSVCRGSGREAHQNNLEIKIPSGLEDGTQVRIKGEGEEGIRGGTNGDLFVEIQIRPHPLLKRKGCDLSSQVPILPAIAILGGSVQIPGPKGPMTLKVPSGTQTGTVFRLRRQGLRPSTRGRHGDLLITVHIDSPTRLSAKERQGIDEAFAQIDPQRYPSVKEFQRRLQALENKRKPKGNEASESRK